ncbi:MAG: hypothetical protein LBI74_00415 [Synergistaceae bacterium]|jgi:hypothetical protein|nr:hypothetical protein [Synergistaceae bacterium]
MKVLFDLRPSHLVQEQDQQMDITRLFSLIFFLVFCLLSLVNIVYIAKNLLEVREELTITRGDEIAVTENVTMLTASINKMREVRDRARIYLEFTRQELPAVEFMAALEGAASDGLTIINMDIRPGNVMMRGSAVGDQDIIDFSSRLDGMKNIVTKVDAPVTTRGLVGSMRVTDFSVTCNIKSLSEIAESMPDVLATSLSGNSESGGTGEAGE